MESDTKNLLSNLLHLRQYVEQHFRSKYNINAYPLLDVLMSIGISEPETVKIDSLLEDLDMSYRILERYLAIAEDRQLITIDRDCGGLDLSLTRLGSCELNILAKNLDKICPEPRYFEKC